MSLINDALRRAKQQTVPTAPASSLQLRPIEPAQHPHRNSGVLLTIVFVAVLMLAGAVVPMFLREHGPDAAMITASSVRPVPLAAPPNEFPVGSKPQKTAGLPSIPTTSPQPAVETSIVSTAPETPLPQPPPLKLNGIFFHSARPSAIINGKTVYVGSRVGESRVDSISQSRVILVGSAQTNVLSFDE